MTLLTYLYDQAASAWHPSVPGRSPVPVSPSEPVEDNPGDGWWPSDLDAPMSLAQRLDPDNFGPPPGFTFPNTLAANQIKSSPLNTFEGYHFTGPSGTDYMLNITDKTFINCWWEHDYPTFGLGASNVRLVNCAMPKVIIVSGSTDLRFDRLRLTGMAGTDAVHITNDRAGHPKPLRITFNGLWSVGSQEQFISGSNHFDSIQVRGCDDLVIHNAALDHGSTFDSLFNATVFLENANGGNSRALINNVFSRSQGYRHFMLFGSGIQVKNCTFAPTTATLLHDNGAGQVIDVQRGNQWLDGTPISSLHGEG